MSNYRINQNYAKALLSLARERGEQDRVMDDMRLVERTFKENRELTVVMANPTLRESKKVAILHDLFSPHLCRLSMLFLAHVARQKRACHLRGIAGSYMEQYRDAHGIVYCTMRTAVDVVPEQIEAMKQLVAQHTGKEVELFNLVDKTMFGGFRLMFDNNLYDARIRAKIRKLHIAFSRNDYEGLL